MTENSTSSGFQLSTECETEGFDTEAGKTWTYPTNYPLREYQFNIVQEALFKNTLVSLPTGLGKTFIAAVVMYNYYRWYPTGKVIFMAPTRPLVTQQIEACYNIMAIPKDITAELTGSKLQSSRKDIWKSKRVFFVTAQVLLNDLETVENLGSKIKCVVFDEAHRAKGNYAYCQVIKKILPENKYFRVLALSATPGSTFNDVVDVMRNLLISHIEFRTDESEDVVPYVFQRTVETVVVPIGDMLKEVREQYITEILEKYTRTLVKYRVIQGNCSNLTKGRVFMLQKEFQEKNKINRVEGFSEITRCLNICITLYHGFELLTRHGLRVFLSFFEEHAEKPLLRGNMELHRIMDNIRNYLGPFPNIEPLPDGSTTDIPMDIKFGHPKFYKLCDILVSHFTANSGRSSRVIVFCEYRESVREAYVLLLQQKPLIKPRIFIGQGAITQRQQIAIVASFKNGECNTLISTCIGEEGLDVGDVDLIVCFDISNKSPIRMIQRMGRTGRKRSGCVVLLVTEGREQQTLQDCLIQKNILSNNILKSKQLLNNKYSDNPRMIPDNILPMCQKIFITVNDTFKAKTRTIKGMFEKMDSKSSLTQEASNSEEIKTGDRIPPLQEYWSKKDPLVMVVHDEENLDFSKHLEKQRVLQPTYVLKHSKQSEMLVSLLQHADSKRYNIPVTQMPVLNTQKSAVAQKNNVVSGVKKNIPSEKRKTLARTGSFKQTNLRDLFLKPINKPAREFAVTSKALENVIEIEDDDDDNEDANYEETVYSISDCVDNILFKENRCFLCTNFFDCSRLKFENETLDTSTWVVPELSILEEINATKLDMFAKQLSLPPKEVLETPEMELDPEPNKDEQSQKLLNNNRLFSYRAPESFSKVIEKCNQSLFDDVDFTQMELKIEQQKKEKKNASTVNTKNVEKRTHVSSNTLDNIEQQFKDTLKFFKLENLDSLFIPCVTNTSCHANKNETSDAVPSQEVSWQSNETILYTPEKFYNIVTNERSPTINEMICSPKSSDKGSPILCSYERVKYLKDKAHRNLFSSTINSQKQKEAFNLSTSRIEELVKPVNKDKPSERRPKLSNLLNRASTSFFIPKSVKNVSTFLKDIPKNQCKDYILTSEKKLLKKPSTIVCEENTTNEITTDSFCDISGNKSRTSLISCDTQQSNIGKQYADIISNIEDIFDVSVFEPSCQLPKPDEQKPAVHLTNKETAFSQIGIDLNKSNNVEEQSAVLKSKTREENDHTECVPEHADDYLQSLLNVDDICDLSIFGFGKEKNLNLNDKQDASETSFKTPRDVSPSCLDNTRRNSLNEISFNDACDVSASCLDETVRNCSNEIGSQLNCNISINDVDLSFHNSPFLKPKAVKKISLSTKSKISSTSDQAYKNQSYTKSNTDVCSKSKDDQSLLSVTQIMDIVDMKNKDRINLSLCNRDNKNRTEKSNSDSKNGFDAMQISCNVNKTSNTNTRLGLNTSRKSATSSSARNVNFDSDDDFETPLSPKRKSRHTSKPKEKCNFREKLVKNKTRKSKSDAQANPFIQLEAEVSEDECIIISEDERDTDDDVFDSSFVNDETQMFANTQMHAHYLQTVRSPSANRGKFKIPVLKQTCDVEIFSQAVDQNDDTYLNDSFCVGSQDLSPDDNTLSDLEVAELLLQEERKRKKQIKNNKNKKKRILYITDDSD